MKSNLPSTKRSLPIALIRARENTMGPIRSMLADTGLTEQQWRVLRVLSEYGPQDATKVSERACLLLPSLTRIVHTLNQKGLLTRRENLTDRRKQTLEITAAGQKILDDNLGETLEILASFKSKLGEENYEHLLDLLEKLTVSRI